MTFSHSRWARRKGRLSSPAGQSGGLLYPVRHLRFVELIVLVDVELFASFADLLALRTPIRR
jgi:hypothetical protein